MKPDLSRIPLGSIISITAIAFFCLSLALSIASYPSPFSPLDNWMSDLGNPDLNPAGALYFNVASVITGLLLAGFYFYLKSWRGTGSGNSQLLTIACGAGIFSGVALAGIGIFPETFSPHHFIASIAFFLSSTMAILLTTLAMRGNPGMSRATAFAGYLTFAISIVFSIQMVVFESVTIIEWISTLSMILWSGLIGADMYRGTGHKLVTGQMPVATPPRRQ